MTQPLALLFYRKLMPGSQLANRLRDLNYRVQPFPTPKELVDAASTEGPMLIFCDLETDDSLGLITQLKSGQSTKHIPIVAFGGMGEEPQKAAQAAGATLVVGESALLTHLPGLLEQALQIE